MNYALDRRQLTADGSSFLWAVLILDQNGEFFLKGSKDYLKRVIIKVASGSDISDLNGIIVTVTGKSSFLPLNIALTT